MGDKQKSLGFFQVAIVIYSAVGSGPAGIEGVIQGANGISLALIGVIVFPILWGYIQALCALELSVLYKNVNGALGAWTLELFGKTLSFNSTLYVLIMQLSTSSFVSQVSAAYIEAYANVFTGRWMTFGLTVIIIAASGFLNFWNIRRTTQAFYWLSLSAIIVFAVFIGFCIPKIQSSRFDDPAKSFRGINWAQFVNILVYNSAGFDGASSIVRYVKNPRHDMPRAMVSVAFVLTGLYVITLVIPYLASRDDAQQWTTGHFVVVAKNVSGDGLALAVLVVCLMTNLQIFSSSLLTSMYLVAAQVKAGVLPKYLASGDSNETPRRSLLVCCGLSVLFALLPIQLNLALQTLLFVAIILLEVLCFLKMDAKQALFSPQYIWYRRALVTPTIVLAAFIISVQEKWLFMGVLAFVLVLASWSLPPDTKEDPPLKTVEENDITIPLLVDSPINL
jgi:amino acid transporter